MVANLGSVPWGAAKAVLSQHGSDATKFLFTSTFLCFQTRRLTQFCFLLPRLCGFAPSCCDPEIETQLCTFTVVPA